jgi:thioredoxin-like negative regulator of GroEL
MHCVQGALAVFKKLLKVLPSNYDVMWQIAACHDAAGHHDDALKVLQELHRCE